MSGFKHHRNNKHRYNIYESHADVIEAKNFYPILRNTLFFIALILSLLVTSLISFDTYKKKKVQQNQLKDDITKLEFTQVISKSIIKQIDENNSFKSVNPQQLKRIVKNVMEKVKNSPNQIIYTQK
jgi:uncharacterized membrane protein YraQ (UPF0718 family)